MSTYPAPFRIGRRIPLPTLIVLAGLPLVWQSTFAFANDGADGVREDFWEADARAAVRAGLLTFNAADFMGGEPYAVWH